MRILLCGMIAVTGGLVLAAAGAEQSGSKSLLLHARLREQGPASGTEFMVKEKTLEWEPGKTAIIICDMWNQHWCKGATRRVGELAPAMNQGGDSGARQGRADHPRAEQLHGRLQGPPRPTTRADRAKGRESARATSAAGATRSRPRKRDDYPIDQADGGCDDGPLCPQGSPWRSQIAAIEIRDEDAISDSGVEIWNLLESRGITNVMLMGVHTNMCVLGRPFGLRNLTRHGKNVVLVRDLTDTMYNSRSWPYVSHFEGTNRIIEHIEKYVCPTITSTDLTGQPPFAFRPDDRPRAVFLIGDDEYKTETTLPAFADLRARAAGRALHVRDRRPEDAA